MNSKNRMKTTLALAVVVLMAGVVFTTVGVDDVDATEGNVASIGSVEYKTLAEAIEASAKGDTVVLLDDVTQELGIVITDKELTIDLNDKTFTIKGKDGVDENRSLYNFVIEGDSVVTINNGKMVAENGTTFGAKGTVLSCGEAEVILSDLELYNYKGGCYNVRVEQDSTVDITNINIYSSYGGGVCAAGGTVSIDGTTTVEQEGLWTAPYNSMAVAVHSSGKMTIESGTYSTVPLTAEDANNQGSSHGSWCAGIMNSGGTLIINGGDFSNGNFGEDSLATYAREVLMVAATTGATANLTINGGTFDSIGSLIHNEYSPGTINWIIDGGIFNYDSSKGIKSGKEPQSTEITGGTFTDDSVLSYVELGTHLTIGQDEVIKTENGTSPKGDAIVKIGEKYYTTFDSALNSAVSGDVLTIIKVGNYNLPDSLMEDLTFVGDPSLKNTDVVLVFTKTIPNVGDIVFKNLTFDDKYDGNFNGFHHSTSETYTDCIIKGELWIYGTTATFERCVFDNVRSDKYNIWCYGSSEVSFEDCQFNCGGKSVLIFNEGSVLGADISFDGCTFTASDDIEGKAAIEIDGSLMKDYNYYSVEIDDSSASGFSQGSNSKDSLWNNKTNDNGVLSEKNEVIVNGNKVLEVKFPKGGEPIASVEDADGEIIYYSTIKDAFDNAVTGCIVTVLKDTVASEAVDVDLGVEFIISEGTTLDMGSYGIIVDEGAEMTVNGSIKGIGIIEVYGNVYLEEADVRMSIIVHDEDGEEGYVSIIKPKKMTVTGNQTADLGVGYGNTLVLKDLEIPAGKNVQAWGTVIVEGTVTVEDGATFDVYLGGNAQIDGALVIEGDALVQGKMDVDGSVKVYNENGGATFELSQYESEVEDIPASEVNVNEGATFDVLKARSKDANIQNSLSSDGLFNVYGTLTVTGDVSGLIMDSGTFNINGESSGIVFVIMTDGTSMTVGSIDGMMMVMSYMDLQDIEDMTEMDVMGDLPMMMLRDVGGVNISASYETINYDNPADKSKKLRAHLFGLDVSGTLKAINDDVKAFDKDAAGFLSIVTLDVGVVPEDAGSSYVNISDITLGKNTGIQMGEGTTVSGTVTATSDYIRVDTDGSINVEGTIIIGDDCITNPDEDGDSTDLQVNGAKYTVTDNTKGETTTYYTTLENALANVSTADENEVYILGEIDVDTVIEIPAEATVTMNDDSEITIGVDGKITVAEKALLNVEDGSVIVDGMLVIMDKEYGLEGDNLTYQVFTETETTATYSGLVLALKNAIDGDTITIVGETAKIEKSVTIPEGVTLVVPSKSKLTIGSADDKVVLTVAGKLEVAGKVIRETTEKEVSITVPGVIAKYSTAEFDFAATGNNKILLDDYVAFDMKIDGKLVDVYSNLAYAAENATEGPVAIYGDVSAGDVTFTMGEKADEFAIGFGAANSTMTVGTMTLVSNGKDIIKIDATTNGTVTGTVASAVGSVDLSKVSGITVAVGVATDVDGSTDYMTVSSVNTGLVGKMSVTTGTVTVDAFTVGSTDKNVLVIDTGATLAVPSGKTLAVSAMTPSTVGVTQYYGPTVDGTLAVDKGTVTINGEVLVNGAVDIVDSTNVVVESTGELVVLGTVTASSTEENVDSYLKLETTGADGAVLIIGSAPALGANGAIVGDLVIEGGYAYAIAYAGVDMSAADINEQANGENRMLSTEIVLNGVPYMTVYTDDPTEVDIADIKKYMETEGYDISTLEWPTGVDDNTEIGTFESLEAEMELDNVDKVTVSAGVGLQIYVDGIKAVSGMELQFGTHTVTIGVEKNYDGSNAVITVNGVQVANGGTFTIDVDDKEVVIIASGAVPAQSGSTVVVDEDDGMKLTDILLIVLVVLIVIMAIIVALRMMRS